MSELDEAWAQALAEAQRRARAAGRTDVSEYLALGASNDLLRKTAIDWLMNRFTTIAGQANRAGASIQTSQEDSYRFQVGRATMVGNLLTLTFGVRALLIEAGWPRTPSDGFVRGGGLACGHIKHRGLRSANEELLLVRDETGSPRWVVTKKTGSPRQLHESAIQAHVTKLLSENYK